MTTAASLFPAGPGSAITTGETKAPAAAGPVPFSQLMHRAVASLPSHPGAQPKPEHSARLPKRAQAEGQNACARKSDAEEVSSDQTGNPIEDKLNRPSTARPLRGPSHAKAKPMEGYRQDAAEPAAAQNEPVTPTGEEDPGAGEGNLDANADGDAQNSENAPPALGLLSECGVAQCLMAQLPPVPPIALSMLQNGGENTVVNSQLAPTQEEGMSENTNRTDPNILAPSPVDQAALAARAALVFGGKNGLENKGLDAQAMSTEVTADVGVALADAEEVGQSDDLAAAEEVKTGKATRGEQGHAGKADLGKVLQGDDSQSGGVDLPSEAFALAKDTEGAELKVQPDFGRKGGDEQGQATPSEKQAPGGHQRIGTGNALVPASMELQEKMKQSSESAGQSLPSGAGEVHAEAELAKRAPAAEKGLDESVVWAMSGQGAEHSRAVTSTASLADASGVRPTEKLDSTRFAIGEMVVHLKQTDVQSLSAVVRPDNQTELLLHVKNQAGQIEVQAQFQRGDASALQANWAQLQEQLSKQGIKLAPLDTASNGSLGTGGQQGQPNFSERQSNQSERSWTATAQETTPTKPAKAKIATSTSRWEIWA